MTKQKRQVQQRALVKPRRQPSSLPLSRTLRQRHFWCRERLT